jgi:hypothetical protein
MANNKIKPRWKPGESGNPAGRPKGTRSIPDMLRKYGEFTTPAALFEKLRAAFPDELKKIDKLQLQDALWLSAYMHAIKGESWAFNMIADRLEGKPTQQIEAKGDVTLVVSERFLPVLDE